MSEKLRGPSKEVQPVLDALTENREWLERLARSLVFDPGRADDVVQQVFIAALRYRPDAAKDLKPWLSVVARAAAKKMARSEFRRTRRETASAKHENLPFDEAIARLESEDARTRLAEFVQGLGTPYRDILVLHFFEGLTLERVAERLGTTRGKVFKRLHKALDLLRSRLDSHYKDRNVWALVFLPIVSKTGPALVAAPPRSMLRKISFKSMFGAAAAILIVPALISMTLMAPSGAAGESGQEKRVAGAGSGANNAIVSESSGVGQKAKSKRSDATANGELSVAKTAASASATADPEKKAKIPMWGYWPPSMAERGQTSKSRFGSGFGKAIDMGVYTNEDLQGWVKQGYVKVDSNGAVVSCSDYAKVRADGAIIIYSETGYEAVQEIQIDKSAAAKR